MDTEAKTRWQRAKPPGQVIGLPGFLVGGEFVGVSVIWFFSFMKQGRGVLPAPTARVLLLLGPNLCCPTHTLMRISLSFAAGPAAAVAIATPAFTAVPIAPSISISTFTPTSITLRFPTLSSGA